MNPEIKARYNAWWAKEELDRPVLHITVRDRSADWEHCYGSKDPQKNWGDLETRWEKFRFERKHTKYFAEAYPLDWVNFGPGCMAAMIGSDYIFARDTVWFGEGSTFYKDWSNLEELRLLEDSEMYNMVVNTTKMLAGRNDGSYIVGMTDLGGNLDILASLRNTEDLLMDLYDNPEAVIRAVEIIDAIWVEVYGRLNGIIAGSGQQGTSAWLAPWCKERYYPLQCDFSAMISPDDFGRFVMPSLRRISEFLDHSIYHLDGPGELPHVDHLLSLDLVDGIQWVPGDGNDEVWNERWFPLYEKIQAAGKNLVLHGAGNLERALNLCKNLSPRGLWLSTWMETEEEANELIIKAVEYSKKRK